MVFKNRQTSFVILKYEEIMENDKSISRKKTKSVNAEPLLISHIIPKVKFSN